MQLLTRDGVETLRKGTKRLKLSACAHPRILKELFDTHLEEDFEIRDGLSDGPRILERQSGGIGGPE